MDTQGRYYRKAAKECDDQKTPSPQRLSSARPSPGDQSQTAPDNNVGYALRQTSSLGSGKLSRQSSNQLGRQKSVHLDGRPEERRSFAQKLHLYPHRPHSSNTSRNSSTNTSSSSLQSLADNHPGSEAGFAVGKPLSDSSTTLRAGESNHSAPLSPLSEHPPATTESQPANYFPKQPTNDFPVYPDQSYAAVQNQIHPPTYKPPFLRSRSSYPSHFGFPFQSTALSWLRDPSSRPQGSRTAGNTPISSPGLFSSPISRPTSSAGSEDGRIGGSHLHPTHMQEPKETHTVEVDRDVLTGNKLINEYEILEELGRGEHGKVKLGRHLQTGQTVAIKIVQRYSKRRRLGKLGNPEDKVKKEVAILKKARHPNVVSLLEVIDDPNQQKVYIVLEYVENLEIVWRKKGLKEIVMVDKRRLRRDRQNIPDSPSFIEESQQFVFNAQMRRRRIEAARRRKRSISVHGAGIPAWSLEHGAESDDEIGPEYCFRLPTNSSVNSHDPHDTQPSPGQSVSSTSEFDRRMREAALAAVEGSMFGAYATDLMFERRHSAASSHLAYQSSESEWLTDDDDMAYVPCLTLSEARGAFRDSVLGLEYLHYQGIIHRDIKPANLLVTGSRRVKISDFGVSYLGRPIRDDEEEQVAETDATELDDARELSKTVGTPAFYAPELCCTGCEFEKTIGHIPKITGAIDVWSLGVTLYGMIFGRLPFVADDEFSLFQNIVKQDVFIPRKRLKAVEAGQPFNQPLSQKFPIMNSNKRMEDELVYEEVDDELRDLLSRLLIKDPTKRITLKEIKHHPWVLQGIQDPQSWIEETDPGYQSKGKKIEVTNDEVIRAVTKMPFIERVRSNVARWSNIFGRRRAPSSAASTDTAQSTSSSSSMTIGKDIIRELRRASFRGDEEITRTPKAHRESEHPLSQSVVASPDANESRDYFSSRGAGPGTSHTVPNSVSCSPGQEYRPDLPERTVSTQSNAGSTKTIRPSNLDLSLTESRISVPPSVQETSHLSNIGNLFTAPRKLVKSLHIRDRRRERSPASDHISYDNSHSSPSVALSPASATGQVQPPDLFRRTSPTSEAATAGHHHIPSPSIAVHRRSRSYQYAHDTSVESNFAREYFGRSHQQPLEHAIYSETESTSPRSKVPRVSSIRTNVQDQLPRDYDRSAERDESGFLYNGRSATSATSHNPITSPPSAATISSSSADDFTSEMSHCASHPSIPSVISGASSLSADGLHSYMANSKRDSFYDTCSDVPPLLRTDDTATVPYKAPSQKCPDEDLRYHGDDEDDDSSDEGLTFGKRKCKSKALSQSPSRTQT